MNKHRLFSYAVCCGLFWLCFSLFATNLVHAETNGFRLPQTAEELIKADSDADITVAVASQNTLAKQSLFYLFVLFAASGLFPVIIFFIEHNLSGFHAILNHFYKCKDICPKVAVIIPAWNEASVLEHTLDIFLKIDYPLSALRLYIVDDGSTDNSRKILQAWQKKYPDNVFPVFKNGGGKGKAHAVNFGLEVVLQHDWAEAVLLIDADISFKKDALRRMVRHLADPSVGAVTAYIKVGNRNMNYITRSIGYEYIVSQSIARRAQNVLGVIACLAGGAQLHTIENIKHLGGQIDTSTLAEDTFTTFQTQKLGKQVIFEGNAFVYAEEPTNTLGVWKQRFRWARGNIQITRAFKNIWFRKRSNTRLSSIYFGLIWFAVLLTPLFMILSSVGFLGLFYLDADYATEVFYNFASVSLYVYLYTTLFAILVDRRTSRYAWLEGVFYPGLIALGILLLSTHPDYFTEQAISRFDIQDPQAFRTATQLFIMTWSSLCMFWAWLVFRLERFGLPARVANVLMLIVGYGPLLCVVNLAAYLAEIKKPNLNWDKTEKAGSPRRIYPHLQEAKPYHFDQALAQDQKREYAFLYRQIMSLLLAGVMLYLLKS